MDVNVKEITTYQTDDGKIHMSKNVARLHAASLHFTEVIKSAAPGIDDDDALNICTALFEHADGGERRTMIHQYLDLVDEVNKELYG